MTMRVCGITDEGWRDITTTSRPQLHEQRKIEKLLLKLSKLKLIHSKPTPAGSSPKKDQSAPTPDGELGALLGILGKPYPDIRHIFRTDWARRCRVIITPPKRDDPLYPSKTPHGFSAAERLRSTPHFVR